MKKIILALMLMSVFVFADVHPALKEAIDTQNYKQAENLIKNVGIKDVYCPSTLSADDADKIYGKVFSDSIDFLLKNCDLDFSKTYMEFKCAGGTNKTMCLNLINLTNPNSWPESYAQKFCTKKNVEICAAALERIPIDKSIPYLNAIKINKLTYMNVANVKKVRSGDMTKDECLSMGQNLYNNKLAEIEREIDRAHFGWRQATNSDNRYFYEKKIKYWEEVKREFKSVGLSGLCSNYQNSASFEKLKLNQYYFEKPFWLLSHKATQYYWNIRNPIIPKLADHLIDVDKLSEIITENMVKSIESLNDTLARLKYLSEYMEKLKVAPNMMYKSMIKKYMKLMFTKNEKLNEMEQLFYCKLYPSLEKETKKLFGMKMLDCKTLLNDNAKLNDSCETGSSLFNGNYVCKDGKYEKAYEMYQTKFFDVLRYVEFENMESDVDYLCPFGQTNDCVKYGPLYTRDVALKACTNGWSLPSNVEMELFLGDSKDDFMIKNIDGDYALYWSNEETNNHPYMGAKMFNGKTKIFSIDEYDVSKKMSPQNGQPAASIVCLKTKQCDDEFFGEFVCENSKWRKASEYERKTQKLCRDDNRDQFYGDIVCDSVWRKASKYERITRKLCRDDNYGQFDGDLVCDSEWRSSTFEEKSFHELCFDRNYGVTRVMKENRYGTKNVLYYCDKTSKKWIEKPSKAIYRYIQDKRDGKEYRTVIVGDQEWMGEYLDYNMVGSSVSDGQRLYKWNMAQNACPADFRLPNKRDWRILVNFINDAFEKNQKDEPKKETKPPVGYMQCQTCKDYDDGDSYTVSFKMDANDFSRFGFIDGRAWLSKEKNESQAYLTRFDDNKLRIVYAYKEKMIPVRCIKNKH